MQLLLGANFLSKFESFSLISIIFKNFFKLNYMKVGHAVGNGGYSGHGLVD